MPPRALLLACVAALALAVCAPAGAQTPTIPQDGQGLSDAPPGLSDDAGDPGSASSGADGGSDSGSSPSREPSDSASDRRARDLPETGADPRLVLLCGMALTLIGAGLRLRTADAEHP